MRRLTSSVYAGVGIRAIGTGHMPTEMSEGWERSRSHHLQSSVGLHDSVVTACGRHFNPQVYHEVLQACCDSKWLAAIQTELRNDTEYVNYLLQHGGAAKDLRMLTDSTQHDDEFMMKLMNLVKKDKKISLMLCALQDSYQRIREKRDRHETRVAADGGRDPYEPLRQQTRASFGSHRPQMP